MNAQEFANGIDNAVVFFCSTGCPSGQSIAILEETELPFDLWEIEGEDDGGIFEANNCNDGIRDANGWKFTDFNGNLIYKIQVFSDKKIWNEQNDENDAY